MTDVPGTAGRAQLPAADQGVRLGFACQTYSWQMTAPERRKDLKHITRVVTAAGFPGLEPEVVMLNEYAPPQRLGGLLAARDLRLAALCLALDWCGPIETEEERMAADAAIDTVGHMPGALLNLCQLPGLDRGDMAERQRNLLRCVCAVARRAADAGVASTYHPNSPAGSAFRTADDYEILLDGLPESIGFSPDLGHIVRGGMDPLDVVQTYRDRINHIHYKDVAADGSWAPTGAGMVDFAAITTFLMDTRYTGWVVMEDESSSAEADPDAAALRNGEYVRSTLIASADDG
jgi:inosose dehydratase